MSNEQSRSAPKRNGHPGRSEAGARQEDGPEAPSSAPPHALNGGRPVLITGGAGFIGTNLADRLLSGGRPVILYDNLSRAGVEENLRWLKAKHGALVSHECGDVRDADRLQEAVRKASAVFHFAAQVAVTTSLDEPITDFEINARGTLNLLEALRSLEQAPPLLFTSTNKVYGDLRELKLQRTRTRYEPADAEVREHGFSEQCPLAFHSPYGCSKGAACQYVQDYARTFKLPTVVFRMSCIYGPHQFGTEDQGWVAHFLIQALENASITIYGDGRQVRDILFVEDLVDAMLLAEQHIEQLQGRAFNIGGGPTNTTSLLELMDLIGELNGRSPDVRFAEWRPADQLYYVSDTRNFSKITGWRSRVGVRPGVARLFGWLREFRRERSQQLVQLAGFNGAPHRVVQTLGVKRNAQNTKRLRTSKVRARLSLGKLAKAA